MSSAAAGHAPPHVVEDLGVIQLFSDGTVVRSSEEFILPPPPLSDTPSVQWKDVVYDANHGLKVRIYRPTTAAGDAGEDSKKLPVLVYFHGGGFCVGSFELANFHAGGLRLAGELPAVFISVNYRLAPEHRLPAALEDAQTLLSWIRGQAAGGAGADPWLTESADCGRFFVTGDSAGGNIVHHVAVLVGSGKLALNPVSIAGYILFWPYFGGVKRTASESDYPDGPFLTLVGFDQAWRLALPVGATRDHPLANPFGPDSPSLDVVTFPPMLIVGGEHDLLHDRIQEYATRLIAMGKPINLVEFVGQHHGFFVVEPCAEAGSKLIQVVKQFVYGDSVPNRVD